MIWKQYPPMCPRNEFANIKFYSICLRGYHKWALAHSSSCFKSLFRSRYNWAHYMQEWGTWYFLQQRYERKSVHCKEEKNYRARVKICYFFFFFFRVFQSQVLHNYFKVFLLALSIEIMQDICRRPVNVSFVEIQSWYNVPHIATPTQRWATSKIVSSVTYAIFLFFQPRFGRTYVRIIMQKIENLVFLFEIQSFLLNLWK